MSDHFFFFRICRILPCITLGLVLLLAACAGGRQEQPPPPAPTPPMAVENPANVVWNAEPGGLYLVITSSNDLNFHENVPLGLTLCLFQMEDKNSFDNLSKSTDGFEVLRECSATAAGAVVARELHIQPGQRKDLVLDRAEKAKYLGVIANYAHLDPEKSVAVFPYLMQEKLSGWVPLLRTTLYSASSMNIFIQLGASSLSVNGEIREQ